MATPPLGDRQGHGPGSRVGLWSAANRAPYWSQFQPTSLAPAIQRGLSFIYTSRSITQPGRTWEAAAPRRVASDDLVGTDGLLEIEHQGAIYRLRVTALGKLILTK